MRVPNNLPKLVLKSQSSLSKERYCDNGVEKNLHYVIKNNVYRMDLTLPESLHRESVGSMIIEAEILYDTTPKPKDVFQVRCKPFTYKGIVSRDDPRSFTLEYSVSVLSSQHEDMNFIVHIGLKSREDIYLAEGYSEPIQAISKPDVLRNKKDPKKKKYTWNEKVSEALERIEMHQKTQMEILNTLRGDNCGKRKFCEVESSADSFDVSFRSVLSSFKSMSSEERSLKVRKVLASMHGAELSELSELVDIVRVEGLDRATGRNPREISAAPYQPADDFTFTPSELDILFKEIFV